MLDATQTTDPLLETTLQSMLGKTVAGKYQLVRLIGHGGMGAVYEARNTETLKRCAIKLLLTPELAGHPGMVQRFFREARASSVIESDHIVEVFDSGTDPVTGYPYMVMELLHGEDIESMLHRFGTLAPVAATKLLLQASIGLSRAHEMGIVHRDVKPANLFVVQRESGELVVKVLDFGIAKVKMETFTDASHGLTRTGSVLGSPRYLSPEQARGASDIDARSDVWSLGVVLYELLSGRLPFESATTLGDLLVSIITEDIPLLQEKAPWVPPELAEVVHRAMSRDLDKRYRDAAELRSALLELVPDGTRLTPDQLAPPSEQERSVVAPRLTLSDDGLLRATTRSGLSSSRRADDMALHPHQRSVAATALFGALAMLVLGVVSFGAWWFGAKSRHADAPLRSVTIDLKRLASAAPSASAPTPEWVDAELVVDPPGVEVEVDGRVTTVDHGQIRLSGAPGAALRVRLKHADEQQEFVVAITRDGPVPSSVALTTARAVAPARSTKAPSGAAPAASRAPKEHPATVKKPGSKFDTKVDEFE